MQGDELQRITERFADCGYLLRVQEEGGAWVATYAPGEDPGPPGVDDRPYHPGATALEAAQAAEAALFGGAEP